jgi:hypothetical protein
MALAFELSRLPFSTTGFDAGTTGCVSDHAEAPNRSQQGEFTIFPSVRLSQRTIGYNTKDCLAIFKGTPAAKMGGALILT